MTKQSANKKMRGKDLITIGIFSAIYFVINFAFMLMTAKVQKLGAVFLMGLITALIYFATGQFTLVILISMASACILAEVARVLTGYNSFSGNAVAYVFFFAGHGWFTASDLAVQGGFSGSDHSAGDAC